MRPEKQYLFDEISEGIDEFGNFILSEYDSIPANAVADLRVQLRAVGAEMEVVRKRILLKVLSERGLEIDSSLLKGHICVVFAPEDGIETAKCFTKVLKSGLKAEVVSGYFDGKILSASQVKVLATLPGKDEMRSQLLATFAAPLSQTLSVINALLTSVPYCLENKAAAK